MSTRLYTPKPLTGDEHGNVVSNYGRYHREAVSTVYHMIGGVERHADWADKNYDKFMTTQYVRIMGREVEVQAGEGVDELIQQIAASRRQRSHLPVIEVEDDE